MPLVLWGLIQYLLGSILQWPSNARYVGQPQRSHQISSIPTFNTLDSTITPKWGDGHGIASLRFWAMRSFYSLCQVFAVSCMKIHGNQTCSICTHVLSKHHALQELRGMRNVLIQVKAASNGQVMTHDGHDTIWVDMSWSCEASESKGYVHKSQWLKNGFDQSQHAECLRTARWWLRAIRMNRPKRCTPCKQWLRGPKCIKTYQK